MPYLWHSPIDGVNAHRFWSGHIGPCNGSIFQPRALTVVVCWLYDWVWPTALCLLIDTWPRASIVDPCRYIPWTFGPCMELCHRLRFFSMSPVVSIISLVALLRSSLSLLFYPCHNPTIPLQQSWYLVQTIRRCEFSPVHWCIPVMVSGNMQGEFIHCFLWLLLIYNIYNFGA